MVGPTCYTSSSTLTLSLSGTKYAQQQRGGRAVGAWGPATERGEGTARGAEESVGGSGLRRRVCSPLKLHDYDDEVTSPQLRGAVGVVEVILLGGGRGDGDANAPFPGDGGEVALVVIVILDLEVGGREKVPSLFSGSNEELRDPWPPLSLSPPPLLGSGRRRAMSPRRAGDGRC